MIGNYTRMLIKFVFAVKVYFTTMSHVSILPIPVSCWLLVLSGIPQGSILGPLLFIIFINDLPQICNSLSLIFLYADDAKLFSHIKSAADNVDLQNAITKLQLWIEKWKLNLNINKFVMVLYERYQNVSHTYYLREGVSEYHLQRLDSFKDLGVTFDSNLSFKHHIAEKNQ